MLHKLKQRKSGFTIIEVLIVLAIAGLILLIVFLAVPALQRNSKNTQRKNDVQAVLGALQEYTNNNSGQLPKDVDGGDAFLKNAKLGFYQFTTASGSTALTTAKDYGDVNLQIDNAAIATPSSSKMYVRISAKCNATNNNVTSTGATSRSVAVVYTIDTSSGTSTTCQES